ncbi:MAG: acyl-ACP--UDP-N-acetylglucosamine O-acyltransferase [Alphaproteobacteria bacterium]|nr:acyl-ACP--UDP-N-acetylglucosamine O-acyltransferase [Alphaproteobacteria bacterium]
MSQIHPTALIDSKAQLGNDVKIGPFCCVGPDVVLGDNVTLISHVTIAGRTQIGSGTIIYPFASIGHPPQDLKYNGESSQLLIGENNKIREYVTLQPGTEGGGMLTQIGNNNLFMVASHVAHDCKIGNHVIMANGATLGGHVEIDDYAIIGGLSAVHQFVRIGAHAIIGGMSGVENDVIPYGHVKGERAHLSGLNLVGLKRRGFSTDSIQVLRNAYQELFEGTAPTLSDRVDVVADKYAESEDVMQIISFIKHDSHRRLCLPSTIAA